MTKGEAIRIVERWVHNAGAATPHVSIPYDAIKRLLQEVKRDGR